jgi:hypothetical protein
LATTVSLDERLKTSRLGRLDVAVARLSTCAEQRRRRRQANGSARFSFTDSVQHLLERAKRRQLGHEAAARRHDPRCRGSRCDVLVQQLTEQARLRLEVGEIVRREHLPAGQLDGDRLAAPRAGANTTPLTPFANSAPPRSSKSSAVDSSDSTRIGASSPTDSSSTDTLIAMLCAVVHSITTMRTCSAAASWHALAVDHELRSDVRQVDLERVCALRRCVAQRDDVDVHLVELLLPHAAGRRLLLLLRQRAAGTAPARQTPLRAPRRRRLASTSRTGKCCNSLSVSEAASGHALAVGEARLVARLLVKGADSYDDQHDDGKRERVTPPSTQPTIEQGGAAHCRHCVTRREPSTLPRRRCRSRASSRSQTSIGVFQRSLVKHATSGCA